MNKETTREKLHALADDQLDITEVPQLLEGIEADSKLQAELCEIRRTKDLIKHAYPLEEAEQTIFSDSWTNLTAKVAAILILTLGSFSLGWYNSPTQNSVVYVTESVQPKLNKNIIFVGYSDTEKFKQTLAKAEEMLVNSKNNPNAEVYVVASSGGIDLMRSNVSPHQNQIMDMLDQYQSLHFVACNNTIYRYKKEGKPVHLIRNVEVASSAVEFVANRITKGWKYTSI